MNYSKPVADGQIRLAVMVSPTEKAYRILLICSGRTVIEREPIQLRDLLTHGVDLGTVIAVQSGPAESGGQHVLPTRPLEAPE